MRTPKQLLNITGGETMLRETAARLEPLIPSRDLWVVTNAEQAAAVRRELRGVPASHVLAEPVGRNTAAAIGLAAIHLANERVDAVMAVLPSDHSITEAKGYRRIVSAAMELAATPGNLVVLGIPPTHPETGFGYIESAKIAVRPRGVPAFAVKRFAEKPPLPLARKYVASGKYFWNAGMFFWRVSTFLDALRRFLPETHAALIELGKTIGSPRYGPALRRTYSRLENISVDYAIMEPATRAGSLSPVFVIPAKVGWSDIGSWAAVYELLAGKGGANVSAGQHFAHEARGNYLWSPNKLVAAIGVRDLVLVDTDDALLVCSRERSQDVGKIVKWLEERKAKHLL
jgi:mannose-1-phosphate guanylyltransferase